MRNDFIPVHLKKANADLDKHSLAPMDDDKDDDKYDERQEHKSLWQRFLGLFKQ